MDQESACKSQDEDEENLKDKKVQSQGSSPTIESVSFQTSEFSTNK